MTNTPPTTAAAATFLLSAIPADVATEVLLAFLDARDLMRADLPLHTILVPNCVFCAKRILDPAELAWFAKQRVRVDLLRAKTTVILEGPDPAWRDGPMAENTKSYVQVTTWWRNGRLHRDDDLPAVERANGDCEWWVDGKRHRDADRPAVVWRYHRFPEHERLEWWVRGSRHRDNDLPALTGYDELHGGLYQCWYWRGQLHRGNDRPARVWGDDDVAQQWWIKGRQHRDGGRPAATYRSGRVDFYSHGVRYG